MLTDKNLPDEELRRAIRKIARTLEEIADKVDQANMKLDHLIKTYRDDRYVARHSAPYDPFREYEEP